MTPKLDTVEDSILLLMPPFVMLGEYDILE
jgi:hypothetical protein